jgi:tetratricopeptide (TPR) repeat protein
MIAASLALMTAPDAPDQGRMDQILFACYQRMTQQSDVWFDDGDFPKVITLLKIKQRTFPEDYETATDLGWMQENVEDYDLARSTYQRYARENPADPDRLLPEATFLLNRARFGKQPALYDDLVALFAAGVPKGAHPNNYRILAQTYERTKRFDKSVSVWDEYLRLRPDDLPAQASRRRVLGKIGK